MNIHTLANFLRSRGVLMILHVAIMLLSAWLIYIISVDTFLGAIVSTLTGYILQLPDTKGGQGLWGFNGCLVGCAFPTFLGNACCHHAVVGMAYIYNISRYV